MRPGKNEDLMIVNRMADGRVSLKLQGRGKPGALARLMTGIEDVLDARPDVFRITHSKGVVLMYDRRGHLLTDVEQTAAGVLVFHHKP